MTAKRLDVAEVSADKAYVGHANFAAIEAVGAVPYIPFKSNNQGEGPAAGARLGWMTGLWLFLIVALLCTMAALVLSTPQGWEQAKAIWAQFPEMSKEIGNQHDVLSTLLLRLPFLFFLLTLLPGLGGMLGAKSAPRHRPSA